MKAMRQIRYTVAAALALVLSGCATERFDGPVAEEPLVAVELKVPTALAETTRADSPLMNEIHNVIFLIFADTSGNPGALLYRRTINDYETGDRIYLKRGDYHIFAVANLVDENCPNGNAATFLVGIEDADDLDDVYITIASQGVAEIGKMPMCSPAVERVTIASTDVSITLHRLYAKLQLNIYNRIQDTPTVDIGTVISGVDFVTYATLNRPRTSYLIQRSGYEDHPKTNPTVLYTGREPQKLPDYDRVTAYAGKGAANVLGKWYRKRTIEVYTFDNRFADVTDAAAITQQRRAELAPAEASAFFIQANNGSDPDPDDEDGDTSTRLFYLYIYPGIGRDYETPVVDNYANYTIERNSVYTLNVWINGMGNVEHDSRRDRIVIATEGDLENPTEGEGRDHPNT